MATERPLVTISIPTYSRADGHLREALESARTQTYPHLEIVVADNASPDNTADYVTGLNDPRIRFYRHANALSVNDNFNFCAEQANGAYVLLLHDDDVIDPDFVEVCMDAVNDNTDVGIIRTGTRTIDGAGVVLKSTPNRVGGLSTRDFFIGWIEHKTAMYYCSTLFNTKWLKRNRFFQSKTDLFQDVVTAFRLAARFGRADVSDVKASFRRHDTNRGSASKLKDWCIDSLYLVDVMCDLVEDDGSLRQQALQFMCRRNYIRINDEIASPVERAVSYIWVYRCFEYAMAPWPFAYHNDLKPWVRRLRGKTAKSAG
ncbi:MAG: glycosyltransferase family 2 protein [Gammaproteobacteria bacterium]